MEKNIFSKEEWDSLSNYLVKEIGSTDELSFNGTYRCLKSKTPAREYRKLKINSHSQKNEKPILFILKHILIMNKIKQVYPWNLWVESEDSNPFFKIERSIEKLLEKQKTILKKDWLEKDLFGEVKFTKEGMSFIPTNTLSDMEFLNIKTIFEEIAGLNPERTLTNWKSI